jgi:tyrosine-protein kinase Etk/Wzc
LAREIDQRCLKEKGMTESELDRAGIVEPYTSAAQTAEEDDSIDLVELFTTLWRDKKAIFRVTLGAFVIATVVAFLLPIRYTSSTSFVPPTLNNSSSMASALAGQLSALGGGDLLGAIKDPGDLYAGILRSRSIASDLVKRFDLMRVYHVKKESLAEKALGANTAVSVDLKSSIVTVEVTDKSPDRAQQLANAYMGALRQTNGRLALSQSSQRALFFGQQLASEKDDLENAEVELRKTEEQSGLIAPSGQTEAEIKTIADTQAQIALRQVQLAALRDSATEQNPEVIRLRSEIDDLQGQLARLQGGNSKESTMLIPTSKVPELQLEYVRKEREVKYHEALFDMLSRQYEAARLDEAREAPVLQVLDEANYPDVKSAPKRSYYMLGGLSFGFLAGCIRVLVHDRVHALRRSYTAD